MPPCDAPRASPAAQRPSIWPPSFALPVSNKTDLKLEIEQLKPFKVRLSMVTNECGRIFAIVNNNYIIQ